MTPTFPLLRCILVTAGVALLVADLPGLSQTHAQAMGVVKRAAVREAARRATTKTVATQAQRQAADRLVRRWTVSMCKAERPCPLPAKQAATFTGGSYNEVRLGSDTRLFRVYSSSSNRLGATGERYSYWSRSSANGAKAVIDSAIPTSRNGNVAARQVSIIVPRGTTIYEGVARPLTRGPVGGGNQVILDGVRPEWVVRP